MTAAAVSRPDRWERFLLVAILAGAVSAVAVIPFLALTGHSILFAVLIAIAAAGTVLVIADTHAGLCFAAFAIAPLGILQGEVFTVTVNLPEVLILMLVVKQSILFIIRREKISDILPRSLLPYIGASIIAICTGLRSGNGSGRVLQDFRQFTEYIVLFLLVVHCVKTRRQMTQIMTCFLVGMLLVAAHGILQRFTGMGIPATQLVSDMVFHGGIRSGSFYGSTPLGAMMVLSLGITVSLGLGLPSMGTKISMLLCAGACVTAAVFTNTRASWLAIVLALAIVFFGVRKSKALISLAAIGLVIFMSTLGSMVVQRMEKLQVSVTERSLLERVRYYTVAWHIFRAHPVAGLGWGCDFSTKAILKNGRYVPPRSRMQRIAIQQKNQATVHSAYLQLLVRSGALGLLSFLLFIGWWLVQCVRAWRVKNKDIPDHHLFIGISAGLIGYLFHSGLENFFQWPVMSQSFWLLMGLSTVMAARIIRTGSISQGREQEAA